jgi:hypothetical protein
LPDRRPPRRRRPEAHADAGRVTITATEGPAWQPAISETNDLNKASRINFGFALKYTDGSELELGALGFSLQKRLRLAAARLGAP